MADSIGRCLYGLWNNRDFNILYSHEKKNPVYIRGMGFLNTNIGF